MSSGLFERYEQNYTQISTSISRKLNTQLPSLSGEQRKEMAKQVESELRALDDAFSSMEMEANSLPPTTRNRLVARLRDYKADLQKLRADYKKASARAAERDDLLSGAAVGAYDGQAAYDGDDQRTRLLAGTGRLEDASRRLQDSHRVALETVEMGANTLSILQQQGEQIQGNVRRLDEANGYIDNNVRILKNMAKRMTANKLMTIAIIIVLIAIIILILYIKFA